MRWLPLIWTLVIIGGIVYVFVRQERERARSAPLRAEIRAEIEARVCFATTLDRVQDFSERADLGVPAVSGLR